MLIKKLSLFILILAASAVIESCNNGSNGDRAKGGEADTVGNKGNIQMKDSTNGMKDTLKHP
ncbi:hypothetical protein [Mucilaginibacter arboris]|uniref:Uncharacterized protein n=1 Tax=Mucilaginibacter arboris TaxID=2682090 RepID=A0A7K1SUE0_9SPHI|nr:hypothetical protein [Mucilaginibacter arboris]MVN20877.1 hypothetical protein [Mucilaginibacter arboris]